ncbi:hypothetical protein B0E38_01840 [Streptomyces sp. 111WW2]|uniref:hypothetical protein n=1 Tax=Streptomyces sp. 111WW2 TaxID=1945515 RepID=UPI000D0C84F2|nr:hypothetical protein [Streptomyces sp. 111WW2]PSK57995.1 hypothetical protein B0E38_01840 [Streptomyces sp. 111WW2]
MSVEVRLNQGVLLRMLRGRGGVAHRRLEARTRRVAGIAEREAPGSMGRHVDWRVQEGPGGLQGVVTNDHPKVRFVLDGTRPHLIRPRRARALRFTVGGDIVFAKLVRHPGTRANNFMGRALRLGR